MRALSRIGLLAILLIASSCNRGSDTAGIHRIALLLPETKTARYELLDRPLFTSRVKTLCPDCEVSYFNASQDPARQQQQLEAALTQGAKVLVLDPVDSRSVGASVRRAQQLGVPVISYDRLILDAPVNFYVSFDNVAVGALQAEALLDAIGEVRGKQIVMINGSPTDYNAGLFKHGAHRVLDTSGITIAREYDTPDWSPDKAQRQMEQAITALGADTIAGVYCANDGMASGVIAALKGAGLDPARVPVTGQDAEVAAIQRILAGTQAMTVYKAIRPQAEAAAQLAVHLLRGETPARDLLNGSTLNGAGDVPSVLLKPLAVTRSKLQDTVFADGFVSPAEVCSETLAADCAELKIQ